METNNYKNWHLEIDENHIGWLTLDCANASVNIINQDVAIELDQILSTLTPDIKGIIIKSGKKTGFIAGADIEQFVSITDQKIAFEWIHAIQVVFNKLASLSLPTVAMIQGFCLGGGLELALACRYRVIENGPKTLLGTPEVNLGLHPGWGGTVRLPRLIGILAAMQMNITGMPIQPTTALKLGLADAVVPLHDLKRAAIYYIMTQPLPKKIVFWQTILNHSVLRPWVAHYLKKRFLAKINSKHYPAPYIIVENWRKEGIQGDIPLAHEARSIAGLIVSDNSQNLIRVYRLQSYLKNLAKGEGAASYPIQNVHVIGAGVMGGDIAAWCALKGLTVTLQDCAPLSIARAIQRATILFKKKLPAIHLVQAALDRLIPDSVGYGLAKADIVIEAVSENLGIKQAIYQAIEKQVKPTALIATNTSSLPLDTLNQVLEKPERLIGIHFFNPVAKMQLVEIVHTSHTDCALIQQAIMFIRRLDRLPLAVKSCPGFLVNRILMPYLLEAVLLVDESHSPDSIDATALSFGMPMGPIELIDTIGLDVCLSIAEILASSNPTLVIANSLKQKVQQQALGRKSGKGFYQYKDPKLTKQPLVSAENVIVTDRLILLMLNESVACLREEIVANSDLLDAGMIFGIGFAPFRGGPLHYAKAQGIERIIEKLTTCAQQYGDRFKPDPGWALLLSKDALVGLPTPEEIQG